MIDPQIQRIEAALKLQGNVGLCCLARLYARRASAENIWLCPTVWQGRNLFACTYRRSVGKETSRYSAASNADKGSCCKCPNTCSWVKSSSRKAWFVRSEKNLIRSVEGMRFISVKRSCAVNAWLILRFLWIFPVVGTVSTQRKNSREHPPDKNQ